MKIYNLNKLLLFFLIVGLSISFSQAQDRLKVMTYNIWNGFDWGKDTTRQSKTINWIRGKNPDVLALQELCGYTEEKLQKDAAKWDHPYVLLLKTDGYPVGLTSKEPIKLKAKVLDSLWHGMLYCETYGIDFFVVHLSPADVSFRMREAKIISEKIKASRSKKYMILGDFNSHSPFDGEQLKQNSSLLAKYSRKNPKNDYSNLRLGAFDYSVMATFMAIPSIDLCQKFVEEENRYSFPTPALIGIYQTAEQVKVNKERIDYVMANPGLATSCVKAQIFNKEETHDLSDHYPVMVEFIID